MVSYEAIIEVRCYTDSVDVDFGIMATIIRS